MLDDFMMQCHVMMRYEKVEVCSNFRVSKYDWNFGLVFKGKDMNLDIMVFYRPQGSDLARSRSFRVSKPN